MTKQEAEEYILQIPKFTQKNPISHTEELLEMLEITGEEFRIIHVAGTNGKGSVCTYLSSILTENGKLTGLFTSPHLVDINERIQIGQKSVEDKDFMEAFETVKEAALCQMKSDESHPTFFEFIFAMAMVIFKRKGVEYLVLETGLGGRLDATNVFPHPEVTVITSIGMDHMQYLGNTIEEIALEKAGIMKRGVPIVFDASDAHICHVLERAAAQKGAICAPVLKKEWKEYKKKEKTIDFSFISSYGLGQKKKCHKITLDTLAPYQVKNAALVLKALEYLKEEFSDEAVRRGFLKGQISGRMEEVRKNVFVDGAHNELGMKEFLEAVSIQDAPRKRLFFSLMKDKDAESIVKVLDGTDVFDEVILVPLPFKRAMSPAELKEKFTVRENRSICCAKNLDLALKEMLEPSEAMTFCAGSLYLAGEVMKRLKEERS